MILYRKLLVTIIVIVGLKLISIRENALIINFLMSCLMYSGHQLVPDVLHPFSESVKPYILINFIIIISFKN